MSARFPVLLCIVVVSILALGGCSGGGAKVQSTNVATTTTMGQELMDLDKARQQGLISDSEYEKAKKATLKRYSK